MMKNRASVFLKQIVGVLSSFAKAKSMAVKTKTSVLKARLMVSSLLRNRKALVGSVSHKIQGLLQAKRKQLQDEFGDQSKAIVLHNNSATTNPPSSPDGAADKYPDDLTHSLLDDELEELDDEEEGGSGSIIDLVRNSTEEGGDFSLEDQIDEVADLFIMRFHKQMRMQKLQSFKRYQEMLERSV